MALSAVTTKEGTVDPRGHIALGTGPIQQKVSGSGLDTDEVRRSREATIFLSVHRLGRLKIKNTIQKKNTIENQIY